MTNTYMLASQHDRRIVFPGEARFIRANFGGSQVSITSGKFDVLKRRAYLI
jgi:hypothetical protein